MQAPAENNYKTEFHSKLGIASTIIAILTPLILVLFFVAILILDVRKNTVGSYVAGAGLMFSLAAPAAHFAGAGIGLAGIFARSRRKFFPVVGMILNILLGTSGVLLWILVLSNLKWGFR